MHIFVQNHRFVSYCKLHRFGISRGYIIKSWACDLDYVGCLNLWNQLRATFKYAQGPWLWNCHGPWSSSEGCTMGNWDWNKCSHGAPNVVYRYMQLDSHITLFIFVTMFYGTSNVSWSILHIQIECGNILWIAVSPTKQCCGSEKCYATEFYLITSCGSLTQ